MSTPLLPDIALVAAVPAETALLRQRLSPPAAPSAELPHWEGVIGTRRVLLIHCGVGKTNAAIHTALLLERFSPAVVVHFGCAGAYPGSGLSPGDLALATAEIFGDEGAQTPHGFLGLDSLRLPLFERDQRQLFQSLPLSRHSPQLTRALREVAGLAGARFADGPFVTVSTCAGSNTLAAEMARRTGGICESMEGAAVVLACLLRGTPCLELRGISNLAEDRDLSRWDLAAGCRIAQQGILQLLEHTPEVLP